MSRYFPELTAAIGKLKPRKFAVDVQLNLGAIAKREAAKSVPFRFVAPRLASGNGID